jgi:hypothetical protein
MDLPMNTLSTISREKTGIIPLSGIFLTFYEKFILGNPIDRIGSSGKKSLYLTVHPERWAMSEGE